MKNLDVISRRIAVTGIVMCGILLSASLFVFSVRSTGSATAAQAPKAQSVQMQEQIIPLGISNGIAYYIYTGDKWEFNKIDITKAIPCPWVK